MPKTKSIIIADLRGGRNGTDPPMSLPPNQCVEALNVDWAQGTLAHKRTGSTDVAITGGTAFSSGIQAMARFVPGADETAAELWAVDGAATPIGKRLVAGTSWANISGQETITSRPQDVTYATLNGKFFIAADTAVDRLHVWDPSLSLVRRVGLATFAAAPTVANTGSGSYAATIRYYRARSIQYASSILVRRSEPSAVVTFTPSGSGTAARVTRPTAVNESETHWEVEASADGLTYYTIAGVGGIDSPIAIATTTYDDDTNPADYDAGTLAMTSGLCTVPTSWKHLLTDGNRLLGAGAWESGGKNSRIWYTPVLGSTDQGDDERIPNTTTQKNWVDLNENDGGGIVALGGPLAGAPLAWKFRQVWKLVPTGDVSTPYLPRKQADGIGCVAHKSVVTAEDEAGRPAVYFLSHRGPYRIGANGLQYLGRDNEDIWSTVNLGATSIVAFALWHADRHQVWFYIATGSSNDPDVRMVFDVKLGILDGSNQVRGGWAKHTGPSCAARCGTMFANTLGASMSRDLKPYIGRASGTAIQKCDSTSLTDAGTAFQSYVTTKPLPTVDGFLRNHGVGEPLLQGVSADDTWIQTTITRDYGLETRSSLIQLTPLESETRVVKTYEGLGLSGSQVLQLTIGDAAAQARAWTLDALMLPLSAED